MKSYGQSIRTKMSCLATVGAALALAATACSSAEEPAAAPEAPPVTAAAVADEEPQEDLGADGTDESDTPPTTTSEAPATTTTTEPPRPGPVITWWRTPRLYETQLSASWQVSLADEDADPEEVNCRFELLNADGEVIGEGTADLHETNPAGRGMKADYDPGTAGNLGSVRVSCSLQGSAASASESQVQRVNYQGRHPDSVFPDPDDSTARLDDYYFDHQEVAALFPECSVYGRPSSYLAPPPNLSIEVADYDGDGEITENDWLNTRLDFWEETYANWDTAKRENNNGREFATGWWTTRQLRMAMPYSTLTAETAPQALGFDDRTGVITINPGIRQNLMSDANWWVEPFKGTYDDGYGAYYWLKSLYLRLEPAGFVNDADNPAPFTGYIATWVPDDGLAGTKPNPRAVDPGALLWDWVDARYNFPPDDREPAAWAMRTLLESRYSGCVAHGMRAHCEGGEFHASPHMRHPSQGGSRLGSVLWSTVCPEITP